MYCLNHPIASLYSILTLAAAPIASYVLPETVAGLINAALQLIETSSLDSHRFSNFLQCLDMGYGTLEMAGMYGIIRQSVLCALCLGGGGGGVPCLVYRVLFLFPVQKVVASYVSTETNFADDCNKTQ